MRELREDYELFAAALAQVPVSVRDKDGRIEEYGGVIERYSAVSVKIHGTYYVRKFYEFRAEEEH